MWKLIIGGLIGAAVVAIVNAWKQDKVLNHSDLMKRKYEEEKQRRKYSENKAAKYKTENLKLREELAYEKQQKNSTPIQKSEAASSKKITVHRKPQTTIQKNITFNVEEEPIRCIRL